MKKLFAIALLLIAISPVHAAMFGPLFSGSSQTAPPAGNAPVVTSFACTVALPVVNATNVNLVGGGTCNYTATCNSIPCNGGDAITSWAITAQSTANSFSIVSANGILQGGSAAGSVTAGSYTVTVTATNSTGTSPGVVQTVTVVAPIPVVASLACTIKTPITNNTNVTLQAGGNCQYTATCGGGACSGGSAISTWGVTTQTCASCYQVTSSGVLQGSTNAATVTNRADTVTVTATNLGGTSAGVAQTVTAISAPVITNQNMSVTLPITNGMTIGTMHASPAPSSWAITAVSGDGATTSDFAISSGGVITTAQASPPGAITSSGTATISMTATNATGTSATGTATVTVNAAGGDPYSSVDGSPGAPGDTGNAAYTAFFNPASVATPQANPLAKYHAVGQTDTRVFGSAGPPNYAPGNALFYQPPWKVAGVDYPVGIRPSFLPLKTTIQTDVGHGALSCAQTDSVGGFQGIKITGSNCTIQGYDFTNLYLFINGGLSNILISDNYFTSTTNGVDAISCTQSAVTIQYNAIDGNNKYSSDPTNGTGALIRDCWKINYNYIKQAWQDTFNYGANQPGTTTATQGLFVNFNVVQDTGCHGGHSDIYQVGGPPAAGNPWNGNFTFDFFWQKGSGSSLCSGTEGTQGIFWSASVNDHQPVTGSILNTTWITAKNGSLTELNGFAQVPNGSVNNDGFIVSPGMTWKFNYADPTGTQGNWILDGVLPTPSTLLVINNNLNMTSGLSDGAAGWNHNP